MEWIYWLYILPLVLGAIAYLGKSLDIKASLVGIVLGYIFLFSNVKGFYLLLTFFVLGTIATEIGKARKKKLGVEEGKRHIGNVLSNSLSALLFAIIGSPAGLAASFSAALADTLSSEIGMLSKEKPVSILTGEEVPIGENGGITALGSIFMFVGAFLIGAISSYLWDINIAWTASWLGVFGCLMDSILGDAFERRGKWGNNTTNLLATLSAGLMAWIITTMI